MAGRGKSSEVLLCPRPRQMGQVSAGIEDGNPAKAGAREQAEW